MTDLPRTRRGRTLGEGRFLRLEELEWTDARGACRTWEVATRAAGTGAVMMVAWLRPSDRLLLIRQYRPPARGYVLEFPAGLVDPSESAAAAALRELREETGYVGVIERLYPAAYNTPGLSDEQAQIAIIQIDEGREENRHPQAQLQDGEEIEVLPIPRGELADFLRRQVEAGAQCDIKVVSYVEGLCDARPVRR